MLDLLIKSAVRRKVLGFFAINPDQELYAAQVAKEIDESPHAVGLELNYLVQCRFLNKTEDNYRWNADHPYASLLKEIFRKMREEGNREILSLSDLKWRRELQKNLEHVLEDIKKYYDPEKIILFGSLASGKVGPYSDIDLVVIKKTSLPYFKRVQQLVRLLDYNVGIDFFVYTPEEFEEASQVKLFFREEILKKGEVLYEKAA